MSSHSGDVTALLHAWSAGDLDARDRLMSIVYRDLHKRAAACLRRERAGETLQPTALVHEAYLRLVDQRRPMEEPRAVLWRRGPDDAAHPRGSGAGAQDGKAVRPVDTRHVR